MKDGNNIVPIIKQTCVFILCAGIGERWNNYLGIPKQLITFNNETLLSRTIRLVNKELPKCNIFIVSDNEQLKTNPCYFLFPGNCSYTVQTFLSTYAEWKERNIILLGDVFYSPSTIRKIVNNDLELSFFGKVGQSKFGKSRHGEIFALKFYGSYTMELLKNIDKIQDLTLHGGRGNFWDLYHTITSLPYNSGKVEKKIFKQIYDYTDDFDWPADYERTKIQYSTLAGKDLPKKLLLFPFLFIKQTLVYLRAKKFDGYKQQNTITPFLNKTS